MEYYCKAKITQGALCGNSHAADRYVWNRAQNCYRQDHTYFCPYGPVDTKQPSPHCWEEDKPYHFCLLTILMLYHLCREVHHAEWALGSCSTPSSLFMCFVAHVLCVRSYFLEAVHNILFWQEVLVTLPWANPGDNKRDKTIIIITIIFFKPKNVSILTF